MILFFWILKNEKKKIRPSISNGTVPNMNKRRTTLLLILSFGCRAVGFVTSITSGTRAAKARQWVGRQDQTAIPLHIYRFATEQ